MPLKEKRWWNSTVLAIGLASLFSDWSHEMATTLLPSFLISLGGSAAVLGLIEGVADGISSFAKLGGGWYSDRLQRKKPLAIIGYFLTTAGTGALAICTHVWNVLLARVVAWFGRGIRTPVRKGLLTAASEPENYGKAFGLERAMDTTGAIVGPATALWLLSVYSQNQRPIFLWTLVPGIAALAAIAIFVKEKAVEAPRHRFLESLQMFPRDFRKFLYAVGIFGLGDFSHTLLILLATQQLSKVSSPAVAAKTAISLYIFHNVIYAMFSYIAGHMADRMDKRKLLAAGYFLAAVTSLFIIFSNSSVLSLGIVFGLAGLYVAIEEALEDSLTAEFLPAQVRGTGFGTLAFVNAIGDFASSVLIGLLWAAFGLWGFLYSTILFTIGGVMVVSLRKPTAEITDELP
jgi:MFS family permease